jgi:hypothetical protein
VGFAMQVHCYLATAPRASGVVCALFYAVLGENVCGWYTGTPDLEIAAAFFALEQYYSTQETVYCRSVSGDLRGGWIVETAPITTDIRCPLAEPVCHELSRLQSEFVREWIWYLGDPRCGEEEDAYGKLGFSPRPINVRASQLHRFDCSRPVWVHTSPGTDLNLVLSIKKHWLSDSGRLRAFA